MRYRIALLLLLLLGGGSVYLAARGNTPRVDAQHPTVQPIQQTLLLTGRLVPPRQLDLGSLAQSTVAALPVDEGDHVEAGEILLQTVDDEVLARRAEAEARVREAEARLARIQGVGRKLADQQFTQARLEAEDAERAFERASLLGQSGSITEAELDKARTRRDTAQSRRVAARLEAAASGGADVRAAAASLAAAQSNLAVAQTAVTRATVRAPVPGTVLVRNVEIGQVVRPGDVLFTLAGEGPLEVQIQPDEVHVGSLEPGQQALVLTSAHPDRPLKAVVDHIGPRVDPDRGTLDVRLALRDEVEGLQLRPEMSITAEVVLGRREEALVVPRHGLHDLGTRTPWVLVEEDGVARRRSVTLGLEGTHVIEVVDGLSADDVLLLPDAPLDADTPVRPRLLEP